MPELHFLTNIPNAILIIAFMISEENVMGSTDLKYFQWGLALPIK